MPLFMVERRFADELELNADKADEINRVNADDDVRWLWSFLSSDKRKTFCLYEAPDLESIYRAARRAGLPADAVVELGSRITPDGAFSDL